MRKSGKKKSKNFTKNPEDENNKSDEGSGDDEDKEYEVEKIINKRKRRNKIEYLVRWKGFGPDDDTWESEDNLTCPELITEFEESEKNDEQPLIAMKKKKRGAASGKSKKKLKSNEDGNNSSGGEDTEYEVLKILEVHHTREGKREFLVRWKGYSKEDDSWEPEENLNCGDLIENFMKKVEKAKEIIPRETRVDRKMTNRFSVKSNRSRGARVNYQE